jgi:hypothetical protein
MSCWAHGEQTTTRRYIMKEKNKGKEISRYSLFGSFKFVSFYQMASIFFRLELYSNLIFIPTYVYINIMINKIPKFYLKYPASR